MARSEDGRLQNARRAVVDRQKVVSYLLNPMHPDNGGKAAFFEAHGFTGLHWQDFADACVGSPL